MPAAAEATTTVASGTADITHMSDEGAMLGFACGVADHILEILGEVRSRIRVGIEDGGSWRLVKSSSAGPLCYSYRSVWVVRVRNVLKDTQPRPTLGSCGFRVFVSAKTVAVRGSRVGERWETEYSRFSEAWLDRALTRCAKTFRAHARLNPAQGNPHAQS